MASKSKFMYLPANVKDAPSIGGLRPADDKVPDIVRGTYAEPYYFGDAPEEGMKLSREPGLKELLHGITSRLRRGTTRRT